MSLSIFQAVRVSKLIPLQQAHYMAKHKRDRGDGIVPDMKLQVLGKEEAQIARDRLDEIIARALGSERTHMIRCGHCFGPFGGSYPSLEKHLKEECVFHLFNQCISIFND